MVEFIVKIDKTTGKITASYSAPIIIDGDGSAWSGIEFHNREEILECLNDITHLETYYHRVDDKDPISVFEFLAKSIELHVMDFEDGSFETDYDLIGYNNLTDWLKDIDEFIMSFR